MWVIIVQFVAYTNPISYKIEVKPLEKLSYDIFSNDYYKGLVIIKLNKDRSIYLNSRKMTIEQIKDEVSNYCKNRPNEQRIAYIKASKVLPYKFVCSLIDDLKGEGIVSINLQLDYFDDKT